LSYLLLLLLFQSLQLLLRVVVVVLLAFLSAASDPHDHVREANGGEDGGERDGEHFHGGGGVLRGVVEGDIELVDDDGGKVDVECAASI
jgi:hypothetical protein